MAAAAAAVPTALEMETVSAVLVNELFEVTASVKMTSIDLYHD